MKKYRTLSFLFLLVFILVAYLLVTGSPVLTYALDEQDQIPLGTPITWIGLISLPTAVYFGIQNLRKPESNFYRFLNWILKITICLAILWAPICYLLAGNLSYSFTEKAEFQGGQLAMKIFWIFSYALAVIPILILIFHWMITLFRSIRNKRTA